MIVVDAGFLYALVDGRDAWHARAMQARSTGAAEGWITTWPVLAEVAYMMTKRLGTEYAAALMDDIAEGQIEMWDVPVARWPQIGPMMRKYAALPMDLGDASLVLLAEHLGHGRILTTDERDFRTYRWKQRKPFVNLLAG